MVNNDVNFGLFFLVSLHISFISLTKYFIFYFKKIIYENYFSL